MDPLRTLPFVVASAVLKVAAYLFLGVELVFCVGCCGRSGRIASGIVLV